MTLRVTHIASTEINYRAIRDLIPGTVFGRAVCTEWDTSDAELLVEFAGRTCYKAYDRKNPDTAENADYIGHLISQGHFSVLEHATMTFHVSGVSRALLLELERHRHVSFSVESQRYVDQAKSHGADGPVIPPVIRELFPDLEAKLQSSFGESLTAYTSAYNTMRDAGVPMKEARGAARAFLLESNPVDLVITGNLSAWRYVIGKRFHEAADPEIQEFAEAVLEAIRHESPAIVQDITEKGSYS
ncbi:FAD-dependent thymidylate synthase [Actinoplanes sp. CA-054009]